MEMLIDVMEIISWLPDAVFEKMRDVFQMTDDFYESTHYARVIAVFKISLTLCIHLSCSWPDREARGRRTD